MHWVDWCIMIIPVIALLGLAIYSGRYVRGVADYLAAGRVAGRYVISVGDLSTALSVITLVGLCEMKYQTGYGVEFWGMIATPIGMVLALTGFCVYRWRETRALSFGQFLEMRYNRSFRIFAAVLRTFSEMIVNALGPAIAVNFFIYFLGLPHHLSFCGVTLPVFSILLVLLVSVAVICIWPGGRVSLLITDTAQGLLSYPVFVIITGYFLLNISWGSEICTTLLDRVPGESFLNPYDTANLREINIFALSVGIFGSIINRASFFGNDTTGAGRTPHEQKMAGILGAWRNGFSSLMMLVIAVVMITIMNHKNFADEAKDIRDTLTVRVAQASVADPQAQERIIERVTALPPQIHEIGVDAPLSQDKNLDTVVFDEIHEEVGDDGAGNFTFQRFRTLYQQSMAAVVLKKTLPVGMLGLFGLLMLTLVISTDDARIFNASSTFLQDVIMPLLKKPLSPGRHLLYLRISTLGVAAFFVTFCICFEQIDYIGMFLTITSSIWLGGAGPVMLGGLYTRFGNTVGAFSAIFTGAGITTAGIFLQKYWALHIYPFLVRYGLEEPVGDFLETVSSPFQPYIVWKMMPEKFPINSFEIWFIAMLLSIAAYIAGSLLTYRGPYNLDRLLHRGIYSIDGKKESRTAWTWGNIWAKLIGITPEYTRGDRIIAWSVFIYSFIYQLGFCFVAVIIWNCFQHWPAEWWGYYFYITSLLVPALIGIVTTVWFMWGGVKDSRQLFRDLKARVDNPLDDGRVCGQVSAADEAAMEAAERQGKHEN